ncbi:MAG: hypothetical protein JNM31_03020 [Flavobacteriales bacterium]|nr:hypothetical protein [Flavobacteriales bacterium]
MRWRKALTNVLVLCFSTVLVLGVSEWAFRLMLFGGSPAFQWLRDAGAYADPFNEADHWKLYYLFGGEYGPPEHPHPRLGWRGAFQPKSLVHDDARQVGERRPVLLYGDSYAQCMPEVECFQGLLNSDSTFAQAHYLLNYGVGGYGVDQIALLCESTFQRYDRPFVIFSLMVSDMDRSPLDWRTGQKPYFTLKDEGLELKGVPIDPDPAHYIATHGPGIRSYLWRRFLHGPANVLPPSWNDRLKGHSAITAYKIELNTRILDRVVDQLRSSGVDFVFVVFHYLTPDQTEWMVGREDNWRDRMLRDFLDERNVPHIWSKDLILQDSAWTGDNLERYMLLDNGHPTTYFNALIAREMKKSVLAAPPPGSSLVDGPRTYADVAREMAETIRRDTTWSRQVKEKARAHGQTFEERLRDEAWYMVEQELDVVGEALRRHEAQATP